MNYHPLVARIKKQVQERGLWFAYFEHEPVRTSEEAAAIRSGYTLSQGTKAIIVRVKGISEISFVMFVVPGDKRVDFKKVKLLFKIRDLRFATVDEISEITGGVQIGGIPPFGNLFGLKVIADKSVFENEKIIFNAGDRSCSIAMYAEDWKVLVNPDVAGIV